MFVVVRNSESFHFTCSPICQQSSILISSLQPFDGFGMVWFIKPCHVCVVKMPGWTIGFTNEELVQCSLKQLVCMHLYHNLKISSHNNNTIIKPCKWWCLYNHEIKHGMKYPPILVHFHSRTFLELISPGWVALTCQSGTHIVKWVTPHWTLPRISQQQHKSSEVWSRCPCTVSFRLQSQPNFRRK